MVRLIVLLLLVLQQQSLARAAQTESPLRVMTFNIRYGLAKDGDNAWPKRRDLVFDTVRQINPDLFGLQEALRFQLDEILVALPEYSSVGVGRERKGGGEYSAIVYRKTRFDVFEAGTFWLSDAPNNPGSMTWGNQLPRICTWVRIFDRQSERRFYAFNTHWDHQSQNARLRSSQLILSKIRARIHADEPVVLMGDFNAGENNPAFEQLVEDKSGLIDTFRTIHPNAKQVGTFNAFKGNRTGNKIDAIIVGKPWTILDATIVHSDIDGRYPSDHFPVTATLQLQ